MRAQLYRTGKNAEKGTITIVAAEIDVRMVTTAEPNWFQIQLISDNSGSCIKLRLLFWEGTSNEKIAVGVFLFPLFGTDVVLPDAEHQFGS
jgi:hypothetical protein